VRTSRDAPDTRSIAAAIHDQAAVGDVIVYTEYAWRMRPTLTHYLDEFEWDAVQQPADVLLGRTAGQNGTLEAVEVDNIQRGLAEAQRIWLISPAGGVYGTPAEPLQAELWPTAYVRFKIKYIAPRYQALKSQTFSTGRAVLLVRDGVA
jgi:mannosyltransferase